ncbi:hypothetical protein MFLAVUS_006795 [Mucor flavus]|uniref:WRKY domain-containing protein n=1 Tax=Mucor flavus TaxID=439312 RepID=A0ABP9Z2H7_9FUNG
MMSDYNYTLSKDTTKAVPLYHHEQVPFQSFSRQSISNNNNNSNYNLASPLMNNNNMKGGDQNSVSGDLQDIIFSYQSQPELLRLILLSKLEEDKRRAEEAKLRAKELDLLLIQQQQQQQQMNNDPMSFTSNSNNNNANNNTFQQQQPSFGSSNFTMHPTPPISSNSSTDGRVFNHMRRTSLDAILASPTHCTPTPLLQQQPQQPHNLQRQQQQQHHRRDSTLGSSFTGSADSEEFDDRTFSPIPTSTTTPVSASSLLQMESYGTAAAAVMSSLHQKQHPLSPSEYHLEDESFTGSLHQQLENRMLSSPTIHSPARYDFPARPRRRREMQAITKIVETREYPYVDGYFWKNNGNTVQKKTGNKSVYYKCSNSNKGCPVNKTVTWKDQGEYLIKYRGEHLLDCNKVQRIVDV